VQGHGAEEMVERERPAGGESCPYLQGGVGDRAKRHGGLSG
jgi:hypothetical protein